MCHRGPGPKLRERTLPCHFTDGSAAACGSGNTSAPTGHGSRARPPERQRGQERSGWNFRLKPTSVRRGEPLAAGKHRSLPVLYRELYRVLKGHRRDDRAGTLGPVAGDAAEACSSRVHEGRDRLRSAGTAAAPGHSGMEPSSDSRVAQDCDCVILVAVVTAITILGTMVGLWSRWLATRTTKRVQVAVRRKVYEHAMRLPLHRVYQLKSGGASSLLREDAGGRGRAGLQHAVQPLARRGAVRRRAGGPGLG